MDREFDVIVIGAGPAGEVLAGRVRERSAKSVAIVEYELVGGECAFYACMPSKALLRPAEVLREVRRIPGAAQAVTGDLDAAKVLERRDEVISGLDDTGKLGWLSDRGIELVRGHARLEGDRRVRVGDDVLSARDAVVLAVGSGPLLPPIPGLAAAAAWSNREATTVHEAPKRLLVLGGGVVGVEMAAAWSSLGSRVTLIEALERLVASEEPFTGELLAEALREDGVELRLGRRAEAVTRAGGKVTVVLDDGASVTGDELLVAVGRVARTSELGLETIGLEPGKTVSVDDAMRVPGRPWLYAVGDVNGRSLLTHSGKYQARVAADRILGGETATAVIDTWGAPRVVFTDPQIAATGKTLAAALEAGIDAVAIDLETESTPGASFYGRGAAGTTRFVVDTRREVLVGATFCGPETAEFVQAATIAIAGRVPLHALAHAVAPFPTRSELWLNFLRTYEERQGVSLHSRPVELDVG